MTKPDVLLDGKGSIQPSLQQENDGVAGSKPPSNKPEDVDNHITYLVHIWAAVWIHLKVATYDELLELGILESVPRRGKTCFERGTILPNWAGGR